MFLVRFGTLVTSSHQPQGGGLYPFVFVAESKGEKNHCGHGSTSIKNASLFQMIMI